MAYYDYYHNAPGWGTSQYQFMSPPVPSFQPQPSWGGVDYYRAYGGLADKYVLSLIILSASLPIHHPSQLSLRLRLE